MFVIVGGGVGLLSVFMGIGGGVLLVFVLVWFCVNVCVVIGCVVFCGFIIVVFGIMSFIVVGYNVIDVLEYSLGYVYLLVIVGIVVIFMFIVNIGVKFG